MQEKTCVYINFQLKAITPTFIGPSMVPPQIPPTSSFVSCVPFYLRRVPPHFDPTHPSIVSILTICFLESILTAEKEWNLLLMVGWLSMILTMCVFNLVYYALRRIHTSIVQRMHRDCLHSDLIFRKCGCNVGEMFMANSTMLHYDAGLCNLRLNHA